MSSVINIMKKDILSESVCYRLASALCYVLALVILTKGTLRIAGFDMGEVKLFFSVLFISGMFLQLLMIGLAFEIIRCLKTRH